VIDGNYDGDVDTYSTFALGDNMGRDDADCDRVEAATCSVSHLQGRKRPLTLSDSDSDSTPDTTG
jgi:hypothetical protein